MNEILILWGIVFLLGYIILPRTTMAIATVLILHNLGIIG